VKLITLVRSFPHLIARKLKKTPGFCSWQSNVILLESSNFLYACIAKLYDGFVLLKHHVHIILFNNSKLQIRKPRSRRLLANMLSTDLEKVFNVPRILNSSFLNVLQLYWL
jgi:hypothetical protein